MNRYEAGNVRDASPSGRPVAASRIGSIANAAVMSSASVSPMGSQGRRERRDVVGGAASVDAAVARDFLRAKAV